MTFLQKIALSLFLVCLSWIGITSGYWVHLPVSCSSCELLERSVPSHGNKPTSERQLTNDAEFVEDLSIRHVDEQFGPHSGHFESFEDYGRRRDECMSHLFQAVARNDGVTVDQVRAALNQRPLDFDVATILSFVIIYSWVANAIAFRIWRSHGLDFGVRHAKIISVYAAILLGLAFVMAGEGWCDTMETIRHGNGHQSYRGERVPWTHHHYLEYVSGVAIFCGIAILQQRAARLDTSSTLAGESHPIAG